MSEVAKYVYVDDAEHVARIKKGIERKTEKYGAGYCPCVGPAAQTKIPFVLVRNIERQDIVTVRCTRSKKC